MLFPEKSLLDHLPGMIGWKDVNRHYVGANKALLSVKGVSDIYEITGKTDEDLSPESVNENENYQQQDSHVLNGSKISIVHFDMKSNQVFLLEKLPLVDQDNVVTGLIYHCHRYHQGEFFRMLRQFDEKMHFHAQHYSLHDHHNQYELTNRELECVFLLLRGKSAKEIGVLLSLSKRTVESYIENIKNKMDCQNKAEVLVKAVLNGYHTYIPTSFNRPAIIKAL